jgi:tetratricopeptide (TPR) repeat protein
LLGPPGALAGQIVGISAAAKRLAGDAGFRAGGQPRPDRFLLGLIRNAAKERPVVMLVEDADRAEASWWTRLLLSWATELDAGLPVVLVLTLDGPETIGSHEEDETSDLYAARELVAGGVATWIHLGPIDETDVQHWLGVDSAVGRRLAMAGGGAAALIRLLFDAWAEAGVISQPSPEQPWRIAYDHESDALPSVKDVVQERIERCIGTDDPRVTHQAFLLLAHGALEGSTFTADVAADVLETDRDEVVHVLDAHFAGDGDRLVEKLADVSVTDPDGDVARLCRYRFTDRLTWLALRSFGLTRTQRADASRNLAAALERRYGSEHLAVSRSLAELWHLGGDDARARRYRMRAERSDRADVLRWYAQYLLTLDTSAWGHWQCRQAAGDLIAAMEASPGVDLGRMTALIDRALDLARRARERALEARATVYKANVLLVANDLAGAEDMANESIVLAEQLSDPNLEAQARLVLAGAAVNKHRPDIARNQLERAIDQSTDATKGRALMLLGRTDANQGDRVAARSRLAESVHLLRKHGARLDEARARRQLAALSIADGDLQQVRSELDDLLRRELDDGNRVGEAATVHLLGCVELGGGHFGMATQRFGEALAIDHALGLHGSQANARIGRALAAGLRGEVDAAQAELESAIELYARYGARDFGEQLVRLSAKLIRQALHEDPPPGPEVSDSRSAQRMAADVAASLARV